jgi:DNA-binding transcriptional MerR regulator
METENRLLTISEASQKLKVPKHTLRFWEKEFGDFLIPQKTSGGQRRYSIGDLAVIEGVKKLRNRGMSLTDIKKELSARSNAEDSGSNGIDLLASRVAEVVKKEVYHFFGEE